MSGLRMASQYIASETPAPELPKTDSTAIALRSWANTPFAKDTKLELPIYDLITGDFTNENVILD